MNRVAVLVVAVGLLACKKEPPSGLPPASDWKSNQGSAPAQPPPQQPPAGSNPHGGADPHAGVGGPGSNPHGNVPPAANPHGGTGKPVPDAIPSRTPPATLEKLPDGRLVLGPFTVAAPADWTVKPVSSSMRAAHFELSAKPGEEAELVVYYFGEAGAGGVEANLDRWLGQFQQPDGKPSKGVAKIEKAKIAGQDATTVSVSGRFQTQQMPGGPPPVDMQDGALIAAIVGSPKGPYYFKLTGRKKTVDGHTAKFKAMLASMKLK